MKSELDFTAAKPAASRRWPKLSLIITVGLITLSVLVSVKWINLNRQLIRSTSSDPLHAAREVAIHYEPAFASASFELLTEHPGSNGELITVMVREQGTPVAFITLKSFLGFGWQERGFRRI